MKLTTDVNFRDLPECLMTYTIVTGYSDRGVAKGVNRNIEVIAMGSKHVI